MKKLLLIAGAITAGALIAASVPAQAKEPTIKCAGLLVDVDLKPNASPLAVIYDEEQHRVCTIDRTGSGHDPLKHCLSGTLCWVRGTYQKVGNTYSIRTILDYDAYEDDN